MPTAAKPNIHQRLLAITADAAVEKGGKAPDSIGAFAFHRIDDIEAALKPLWDKHGVLAMPTTPELDLQTNGGWNSATGKVEVTFANADKPEECITVTGWGQGLDKQDKAIGKATSYACKAIYLAVFHLKGQPDNEATASDEHVATVPYGKNKGKAWADLTERQLKWYANEAKDADLRQAAQQEMIRRNGGDQKQTISDDIDEIVAPSETPAAEELF